ncbi:TetR/AcrR family transcriptional regulator [Paenibacillus silviterrae]|uniref:TetR/AcrR family transcriptional regulator n=1 Tax=Paenibacillus silviterrae TaxID=3242194 RepID=UPI0025432D73|nr:TetR/AcrR family transcriptional regulator [Paenibacillus chinjuensis]
MPKVGMEPKRRADVINAALTCISVHGMDGMTLDKVAEYAKCSKGVIIYYFKNKDQLIVEAFRSFMAYYGLKIQSEIDSSMPADQMIDITMKHILPPYDDDKSNEMKLNVSPLDGIEAMFIPIEDQARLFLQLFSKAVLDRRLQEVVSTSYMTDLQGIAKIFDYGNRTGRMNVEDPQSAAYGLLAMVIGLSFFRVANIPPVHGEDNRYVGEDFIRKMTGG